MRLGNIPNQIVILLVALLMSGCANAPPKPECAGSTCTPATTVIPPTSPIVLPPIDYPIDAPQVVQFEGCEGGLGLANVPMENAQAVVPDDFEIAYGFGAVPTVTSVQMLSLTCSRVVVNNTILTNVSWFHTLVFVSPKNESWRGNGANQYLLDSWFSAPELAAWFKSARIPAEAATFRREGVPAGSAPRTEQWNVDGDTCDISADFNVSGQTLPSQDAMFFYWVGPTPYQRVELFEAWVVDAHHISASPFRIEGECTSQRALEGVAAQGTQYNPKFNATMTITGNVFM